MGDMPRYPLTVAHRNFAFDLAFVLLGRPVTVTDASGRAVMSARLTALRPREEITILGGEGRPLFRIGRVTARDARCAYAIGTPAGAPAGAVTERTGGWTIADARGAAVGGIERAQPWGRRGRLIVGLFGGIPVAGAIIHALLGPAYTVDWRGGEVFAIRRRPAVLRVIFMLQQRGPLAAEDEALLLAGVLTVLIHARA